MKTFAKGLKPTKTKACRTAHWTLYTAPGFFCGGVLQIDESVKTNTKVYARRYAVQELPPGPDGRRFKLSKPKAMKEDPYFVLLVPPGRGFHRCDCRGYEKGGTCTHVEALTAFAAEPGALPVATPAEPQLA